MLERWRLEMTNGPGRSEVCSCSSNGSRFGLSLFSLSPTASSVIDTRSSVPPAESVLVWQGGWTSPPKKNSSLIPPRIAQWQRWCVGFALSRRDYIAARLSPSIDLAERHEVSVFLAGA